MEVGKRGSNRASFPRQWFSRDIHVCSSLPSGWGESVRILSTWLATGCFQKSPCAVLKSAHALSSQVFITNSLCISLDAMTGGKGTPKAWNSAVIFAKIHTHCRVSTLLPYFNHTKFEQCQQRKNVAGWNFLMVGPAMRKSVIRQSISVARSSTWTTIRAKHCQWNSSICKDRRAWSPCEWFPNFMCSDSAT